MPSTCICIHAYVCLYVCIPGLCVLPWFIHSFIHSFSYQKNKTPAMHQMLLIKSLQLSSHLFMIPSDSVLSPNKICLVGQLPDIRSKCFALNRIEFPTFLLQEISCWFLNTLGLFSQSFNHSPEFNKYTLGKINLLFLSRLTTNSLDLFPLGRCLQSGPCLTVQSNVLYPKSGSHCVGGGSSSVLQIQIHFVFCLQQPCYVF